ncbi:MAG: hypothetical protein HGA45_39550, partial [Chloroflexales bacterium]|nr:hypothetical protein [Chloroflexales bacterium]
RIEAIYLDLSACEYMDSTFLGFIVGAQKRFAKTGEGEAGGRRSLVLLGVNEACMGLLRTIGILGLVRVSEEQVPFPAELELSPVEARPAELAWLFKDGAEAVERLRFRWRGESGSILLVTSTVRRAHHNPQGCFTAYGLSVDRSYTHFAGVDLPVRVLDLRSPGASVPLTARYWFQSATRVTDDYGARFWADVTLNPQRWVLVSILFDRAVGPGAAADVDALSRVLQAEVARQLSPSYAR